MSENNNEQAKKAAKLVYELMNLNDELSPGAWFSAFLYWLVTIGKSSGSTFEEFNEMIPRVLAAYKQEWNEQNQ